MTQSISHLAGHVREAGSAETYDPQVLDTPRSQLAGIEPISVWLTDFAMNTRLTDGCGFVIATTGLSCDLLVAAGEQEDFRPFLLTAAEGRLACSAVPKVRFLGQDSLPAGAIPRRSFGHQFAKSCRPRGVGLWGHDFSCRTSSILVCARIAWRQSCTARSVGRRVPLTRQRAEFRRPVVRPPGSSRRAGGLSSVSPHGSRGQAGLFRCPKSSFFGTGLSPGGCNSSPVVLAPVREVMSSQRSLWGHDFPCRTSSILVCARIAWRPKLHGSQCRKTGGSVDPSAGRIQRDCRQERSDG